MQNYTKEVVFDDYGVKLFRPNKYWLAVNNDFNFNEDFEIILELSFPEIPWETQTLFSNTSSLSGGMQSFSF